MMTMRSVRVALWVSVLAISANPASADPIVFATRVNFDAAFPSALVENWDRFSAAATFPNGSTTAGITYFSSRGVALVQNTFLQTTFPNTLGRTEGGFFTPGDTITFGFAAPLMAFGIDINTFARANGSFATITNTGEVIGSFFNPFPGRSTGQFVGFSTGLPFQAVTIFGIDTFTLDTLREVPAVPEPASLWLLGTGAVALLARRRRQR
jgi:hypothetical protein